MRIDEDQNEIDELEKVLKDFKQEWEVIQSRRASTWRKYFIFSFVIAMIMSVASASLWWGSVFVIGYFGGSLYAISRQNAKTSHLINEHQKQLKLVRLLRNFQASPFSQK